jgi:hypothetical protein
MKSIKASSKIPLLSFPVVKIVFLILVFCLLLVISHQMVAAQGSADPWSIPVNLSNSGGATNPYLVIDSTGRAHAIWEDINVGSYYTYRSETEWSAPALIRLPFATYSPVLVSDNNGTVHAFWVETQGRLYYSNVVGRNLAYRNSWRQIAVLSNSTVKVAAAGDDQGGIHTAYIKNQDGTETPAGVYYRSSNNSGKNWISPIPLYTSPYFRGLEEQAVNLSISTATNDTSTTVYVAWDNRPRNQIYLIRSVDGGNKWQAPLVLDKPTGILDSALRFNVQVSSFGRNALLLWHKGDHAANCTQYYQYSSDVGETWSEPETIKTTQTGCPESRRLISLNETLTLQLTQRSGSTYLQAWNGFEWSEPQLQSKISSFQDPETFDQVSLGCLEAGYYASSDELVVTGCGDKSGSDIWFFSRFIGSVSGWYPAPSIWSTPANISSAENPFNSPTLLAGSNNVIHAMWAQVNGVTANDQPSSSLYYARFDGRAGCAPLL